MLRPKIFLDENVSYKYTDALRVMFKRVIFSSNHEEHLTALDDVSLFGELGERGFQGIVTIDRQQLDRQDERDALRAAGLHWIGLPSPRTTGLRVHAELVSTIAAAIPYVLEDYRDVPHTYRLSSEFVAHITAPAIDRL